jgi:hypothetical protein
MTTTAARLAAARAFCLICFVATSTTPAAFSAIASDGPPGFTECHLPPDIKVPRSLSSSQVWIESNGSGRLVFEYTARFIEQTAPPNPHLGYLDNALGPPGAPSDKVQIWAFANSLRQKNICGSGTAAVTPSSSGSRLTFDECMSQCQQITNRSKEQCFDACK